MHDFSAAITMILCAANNAAVIKGCFSKKLAESVCESIFDSALCFLVTSCCFWGALLRWFAYIK